MDIFVVICYLILIIMTAYGLRFGMVKVLTPIVSGLLSLTVMLMLKSWAFGFLFQWAVFRGEHILPRIVVIILVFILGMLLFRFVVTSLNLLSKLPIIHGLNRICGGILGLAEGIIIVWLLLYFVFLFPQVTFFRIAYNQIRDIPFLLFLYENNLVKFLIEQFTTYSF